MEKVSSINIDDIAIAAPCDRKWSDMKGNEKVRQCLDCKLDVFNTTEMTESEIRGLFAANLDGRVCLKLYRTRDGKILTRDCGAAKRIVELTRRKLRLAMATILGLLNFNPAWCQSQFANVDRYGMVISPRQLFTDPNQKIIRDKESLNKEEGAKASALDAFKKARQYELEEKPQLALLWYKAAIDIFRAERNEHDPKFKQVVAAYYVKLLKKKSDYRTAKKIEREFEIVFE